MIEVVSAGTLATVQDWPGRLGYWEVGVPPSGPMDDRAFRIGNVLVGNAQGTAGIEVTLTGPRLRFIQAAVVAVTGAPLAVELDGVPVAQWAALDVPPGGLLRLGAIRGVGLRAYVLVRGGIDVEPVMGSRATFAAAKLGGRPLRKGDRLAVAAPGARAGTTPTAAPRAAAPIANATTLRVVRGPHGAPDLLAADGLETLLSATWTVHHHSDRTGVRLTGPTPEWARDDGGEAGLHPSNILDSAYGVGTVMLAGDMAVVVGPDGPSLGGFAAIAQVIRADLWKLGQVRAGDEVTLQPVEPEQAAALHAAAEVQIAGGVCSSGPPRGAQSYTPPVRRAPTTVLDGPREGSGGPLTVRRAGERGLLVEFGEPVLDLRSRVRAHLLREALEREALDGVRDLTPGVRSLHVTHDPDRLPAGRLLATLVALESRLDDPAAATVQGRVVHLPLAWRETAAMSAIARYQASVRPDAPWCPDNIEFIRRINGLADEDAVKRIIFSASYLVLGLGDVYMGAPVAVPVDPRHRLVTTKYSPARTWTPPNAVGIGGAFLCVYGMEGPGGYQLVGRTVPIWHDGDDPPWRLRHFDELRFEPVDEVALTRLRAASHDGRWAPRVEPGGFSLAEHERFLAANAEAIAAFRGAREAAFAAERDAWQAAALAR
ncbi:MAG: urea carboxylase [Solirubrobacteraceae bacterium]|nr:urea carboxylase [Solirubrobacteraceae bacterium]